MEQNCIAISLFTLRLSHHDEDLGKKVAHPTFLVKTLFNPQFFNFFTAY